MKGHGLVQYFFPIKCSVTSPSISFHIKARSTLSTHCVLGVNRAFCESKYLVIVNVCCQSKYFLTVQVSVIRFGTSAILIAFFCQTK